MREITKTISISVNGNNQIAEAPVCINVTAAGNDPEAVGKSVYDVIERYLLRTLRALESQEPRGSWLYNFLVF